MISFLDRTKQTTSWRPKSNSQLKDQLLKTWEYNKKAKKNLWNEAKDDALKRFLEQLHKKFEDITKRDIMKSTNFRKAATSKRYREHTATMAEEINTMINKRKRKSAEDQR
jgi:23S rRNA maturation mini-RNase III